MNRKYNLKLDLQFRCNNSTMKFNQFDNNTSDFFIKISNGGKPFDVEKAIVVLATIKPSGKVASQFVEVKNDVIYADLKPNMKDEIGTYTAKAMLILEDERVVTDVISYEVEEDKIFSLLNDTVETSEEFTLLTDMLSRLSNIEISEEQRVINEAERILSEENRKIEEAKRVEAELIRQHEEADRAKYDATRESNENIRKQNESIRLANETNRIDEETKRVEEEANRVEAEQLRKDNYNFMTEDEERRRVEANAHKEAEKIRAQAENTRVNEEAKRRTTEQARVSAENTRVNNENTRKANETTRQTNETHRVEAETQRQSRYNSFILDAEANASNFENYTNTAKAKEEERKANELDRKSQEVRRISNEVERISNENTRKANENAREKNETSRQNIFENKVDEVDKKIIEINTTKDNFVSSINTKVDTKISELDNAKSDMTNTVSNKVNDVENRFNALTSKQQQDAEVIDARDGETSLKARLDRDIEKAKQVYVNIEGSHISTDSSVGYLKDVEILGNTIQSASNLADIRSVGDKVEGQELYEIPVLSRGKNLFNIDNISSNIVSKSNDTYEIHPYTPVNLYNKGIFKAVKNVQYTVSYKAKVGTATNFRADFVYTDGSYQQCSLCNSTTEFIEITATSNRDKQLDYIRFNWTNAGTVYIKNIQIEEGTVATPYEPYQEDKLTILSPTPLEKVGDVADRLIEKDGVWGVEKNVDNIVFNGSEQWQYNSTTKEFYLTKNNYIYDGNYGCICDKFTYGETGGNYNNVIRLGQAIFVSLRKDDITNVNDFKAWLQNNNVLVMFITPQPQFIPLPHSQQIKLRTFANKTNISFLTEVEGTIKAQVPKSIGATVNTHTEQINNLNNELDRVKKLEENTVSTVTTESDFTTVEATSNGYFEDVKLEGKTLVNLATQPTNNGSINHQYATISTVTNIKPSTEYTYIIRNNGSETLKLYLNHNGGFDWLDLDVEVNSTVIGKAKTLPTIDGDIWLSLKKAETVEQNLQVVLLEGDHTQNPPSFFEGLKSVGDKTDEIVVSSVNENLFDGTLEVGSLNASGDTNWNSYVKTGLIRVKPSSEVICKIGKYKGEPATSTDIRMAEYDMNKNFIKFKFSGETYSATVSDKTHYVKFAKKLEASDNSRVDISAVSDVIVVYGNELHNIPHQADKKRLLYYNEETQTWEKPILRQWDSIEKHANGKYYYHQRSGEYLFSGNETVFDDGQTLDISRFYIKSVSNSIIISSDDCITDGSFKATQKNAINIEVKTIELPNGVHSVEGCKAIITGKTIVYQLAQEKVYECTNIDLITYADETNFIVESGVLSPKTTLKVHNNISNVVSLLQKKVSLLESNVTSYMITQNRLMLASRYNADTVSFKVDVASFSDAFEYDNDLYELILNNVLVGKDNYNREYIENLIRFYWMDFVISDEMYSTLFEIIEEQHNPKIEEETPLI